MHPSLLKGVPLFKGLGNPDLKSIAKHVTTQTYPRNSMLVREGEAADALYLVVNGRVKVYVSDEAGKEVVLDTLRPGDFFGELALIEDVPRSATVVTTQESTISRIHKTDFERCLAQSPQVAINLLKTLSKRVRGLNEYIKDLALLDVYGRVARAILRLSHEREGVQTTDPITQQELANIVRLRRRPRSFQPRSERIEIGGLHQHYWQTDYGKIHPSNQGFEQIARIRCRSNHAG